MGINTKKRARSVKDINMGSELVLSIHENDMGGKI